ncbi:MAG: tellurite resistance TerB family protein [Pseudomonadota bacterium]
MVDFNKVLSGLTQSGVAAGLAGGVAGGALTSALTSKKGRKTATSLLKLGGVAAIGGLAWNAYRNYQDRQGQQATTQTQAAWQNLPRQGFDVEHVDARYAGGNSLLIIRAMITAAMSDGHIDSAEHMRIFEHAEQLPLSNEDKAALFDELRQPRPVTEIVAGAHEPAIAVEVYAASLLAIDELTYEGQTYLKRLAGLLKLPPQLVDAVHAEAHASPESADRAA